MTEELKFHQSELSKFEQTLFDYQTEIQRKKQQILEQQIMLNQKEEDADALKDRVEALTEEMKSMQSDIDNNL